MVALRFLWGVVMSERYKREIEEILQQAGELGSGDGARRYRPSLPKLVWQQLIQSVSGKAWSLSPGRIMLVAVVLLLSALVLQVGLLAWAGLLMFIIGYAMFFVRPRQVEKRWRGQRIDYGGESWWDRLRRKIK